MAIYWRWTFDHSKDDLMLKEHPDLKNLSNTLKTLEKQYHEAKDIAEDLNYQRMKAQHAYDDLYRTYQAEYYNGYKF